MIKARRLHSRRASFWLVFVHYPDMGSAPVAVGLGLPLSLDLSVPWSLAGAVRHGA